MRVLRRFLPAVIIVFLFSLTSYAQIAIGLTDEDRAEFARHRQALLDNLELGGDVAVLFGAPEREDNLRFRQDNTFYYFTGVEIPFAALILDARNGQEILFLQPGIDSKWVGQRIGPGQEAVKEFGIQDVRDISTLSTALQQLVPAGSRVGIMLMREEPVAGSRDACYWKDRDLGPPWELNQTRQEKIRSWLQGLLPGRTVFDISPLVDALRKIKSEWEIERMAEACRIAGEGHVAAMMATRPGAYEWEIEAAATKAFVEEGALYPSYGAIVGAGKNSAILHYPHSASVVKKRDLILMDFGPDYRYYSADITRTWPARGKFNKKYRKVYEDCLEVQQKIIDYIKPGLTLQDISDYNKELLEDLGYDLWHGPSHYIGMSVHDVGYYNEPLEPGNVITVEPGIYFEKKWGIRIEDVVVVTNKGCRVLSDMIPKDPDEIEAIMAQD